MPRLTPQEERDYAYEADMRALSLEQLYADVVPEPELGDEDYDPEQFDFEDEDEDDDQEQPWDRPYYDPYD